MKGMTIYLVTQTEIGTDDFGEPIYSEELEAVNDCLVGQPTSDDVTNTLALYGKKIEYTIGIPKGDTHDWTDREIELFGARYRTIGYPTTGIQENIPLRWGQNIKVERYG